MFEKLYIPPSMSCWTGRDDGQKMRFFQRIQCLDCQNLPENLSKSIVLLGFASDEGVRRNLGRVGAEKGPESLRNALRNIPMQLTDTRIMYDAGTIQCIDQDLESAQHVLGEIVAQLRQRGAFVLVLGGGHEVAWGHFQGLRDNTGIHVINFDAHFDLRPLLPEQKGTSGTGFRQMYEDCQKKNVPFHYACLGIQPFGNTEALFDYAASIGTYSCFAEKMVNEPAEIHDVLANWLAAADRIYLTLCLDVFAAAYAPGVSAPQPLGLSPHHLLPFFRQVLESGKVIGFDIAELNPDYDRDNQTAALAAYFIAEVMRYVG